MWRHHCLARHLETERIWYCWFGNSVALFTRTNSTSDNSSTGSILSTGLQTWLFNCDLRSYLQKTVESRPFSISVFLVRKIYCTVGTFHKFLYRGLYIFHMGNRNPPLLFGNHIFPLCGLNLQFSFISFPLQLPPIMALWVIFFPLRSFEYRYQRLCIPSSSPFCSYISIICYNVIVIPLAFKRLHIIYLPQSSLCQL